MGIQKGAFRSLIVFSSLVLMFAACDFWNSGGTNSRSGGAVSQADSVIDASGGRGTAGTGGSGDTDSGIWIESYGSYGIKILQSGRADTSFQYEIPSATPGFGTVPLTVGGGEVTVNVVTVEPAQGTPYMVAGSGAIYISDGDGLLASGVEARVTGIRIQAGATLTLGLSADTDGDGLLDTAQVDLSNDAEVLGILRSAAFSDGTVQDSGYPLDRGALYVNTSGKFLVRSTGTVRTAGDNTTSGRGGDGGGIDIQSYGFINEGTIDASGGTTTDQAERGGNAAFFEGPRSALYLYSYEEFHNAGVIRADGGNGGADGGNGAYASYRTPQIAARMTVYNTGPVTLKGGNGANGNGGNGAGFTIYSENGSLYNSASISTRGGDGKFNGGSGGNLNAYTNSAGNLVNSGGIDTSGGNSTGTSPDGAANGGSAGYLYIYGYNGIVKSSGNLTANGGNSENANSGSYGGNGGYIDIESLGSGGGRGPARRSPFYDGWSNMEISGNLETKGGRGANGGNGNYIYLYHDGSMAGGVVLLGYSGIAGNGGEGTANGGSAAAFYLGYDSNPDSAVVEPPVSLNGGNGADNGGMGGYIEWYGNRTISVTGQIEANGGAGGLSGGGGGSVYLYSNLVSATGTISADGGDSGGNGGTVYLYSYSPPSTYATISVVGGAGGGDGTVTIDGNPL